MNGVAIGGTWLVAQGAASARDHCLRCLDLGYGGIVPAPGTRPVQWADFRSAKADLPLELPVIRVDPIFARPAGSLASARGDEVLAVRERLAAAAAVGRALAVPVLVLEAPRVALDGTPVSMDLAAGDPATQEDLKALRARLASARDRYLDAICRNLHSICAEFGEFRICLTEAGDLVSASEPGDLGDILSDLERFQVGYWHRPALVARRAAAGGPGHGEVLDNLSKYLMGSDLSDFDEGGLQAVPGSGGVDYGLVAPYTRALQSRLPTVVELDPACRETDVRQGRAFLGKFGL